MARTPRLILAALLAAATLALSGCGGWFLDPAAPANKAITATNAALKTAAAHDATVKQLGDQVNAIPYTTEGAAQALGLTARIKEALASEKAELLKAKAALDGLAGSDVKDEFKTYARLEAASIATRIKIADEGTALYGEMDKLYKAVQSGAKDGIETETIVAGIGEIQARITTLSAQAAQQAQEAADYFASKKLGG